MRFILAIISFALAAVMIVFGIAQRTFLAEPDAVALQATVSTDAPVTVIDGSALNAYLGRQTLTVSGSDQVFAAYGRTTDVIAWIGDTEYNLVTLDPTTQELTSELVAGEATEVPDPNGSDLWYDDFVKEKTVTVTVSVPDDVSFIIASDGVAPAPSQLALSWPVDNSTPWSGPLIIGGAIVLLIGLALLLWATNHMRSSRGPRRKTQKMPKVPRKPQYKPVKASRKTAIEKPSTGRRAIRPLVAAPVLLVGALVLSGCTADTPLAAPSPTPSASAAEGSQADPPAVTKSQVDRIVDRISAVVTKADAATDGDLLATRVGGAALELRLANYAIRKADAAQAGLPAIPAGPVKVILPQQTDTWPRTVLAVIQDDKDATVAPVALFLEQASAREDYKVSYAITLEPSAVLPDVAPADVGTARLPSDSPVLRFTPAEIALAYADILEKDVDSAAYLDFEGEGDSLRAAVGLAAKNTIRAGLPTTASVTFGHAIGAADAIALATNDAGAIIAVNLYETTAVAPTEAGAAVNPSGQVKALSGVAVSTKGVIATYSDQLLFYVPPAGANGKIILLGYSQGLIRAAEIG